jgi:hypothetical protein
MNEVVSPPLEPTSVRQFAQTAILRFWQQPAINPETGEPNLIESVIEELIIEEITRGTDSVALATQCLTTQPPIFLDSKGKGAYEDARDELKNTLLFIAYPQLYPPPIAGEIEALADNDPFQTASASFLVEIVKGLDPKVEKANNRRYSLWDPKRPRSKKQH